MIGDRGEIQGLVDLGRSGLGFATDREDVGQEKRLSLGKLVGRVGIVPIGEDVGVERITGVNMGLAEEGLAEGLIIVAGLANFCDFKRGTEAYGIAGPQDRKRNKGKQKQGIFIKAPGKARFRIHVASLGLYIILY